MELKSIIRKYINIRDTILCQKVNSKRLKDKIKPEYTLREIYDDEIVIEFDCINPIRRQWLNNWLIKQLKRDGYKYVMYSHKGKSEHIHLYDIQGLSDMKAGEIKEYKKALVNKYTTVLGLPITEQDISLCYSHSLIALEFAPHHKTSQEKIIVDTNITENVNGHLNKLDVFLVNQVKNKNEKLITKTAKDVLKNYKQNMQNLWFVKWMTNEDLPEGDRDLLLYKNLAILCFNYGIDTAELSLLLSERHKNADKMFKGWLKWCQSGNYKVFNMIEVIRYCEQHGINYKEKIFQYSNSSD